MLSILREITAKYQVLYSWQLRWYNDNTLTPVGKICQHSYWITQLRFTWNWGGYVVATAHNSHGRTAVLTLPLSSDDPFPEFLLP